MRHAKFEEQLVEAGGLVLMANKGVLNPAPRTAMLPAPPGTPVTSPGGAPPLLRVQVAPSVALLTDALNIVSHLARSSAAHYAAIHAAGLYADLRALLEHPDAAVRAKTCNVLGNLCRHSAFFYPHLLSAGLIPPLVARCGEREPQVRKWAAFALGNAVFHDASLAAQVAKAIPVLLKLLRPESDGGGAREEGKNAAAAAGSDRTAQNAAGVLTNLLRHGGLAAHEMIEQGAVGTLCALLEEACVAASSTRISPAQQQQQVQCARSALFTLGDLAAFRAARRELQQAGALERIQQLQQDSSDPKLHTYWQRLLTRYNAPPQG
jgi:fused-like protein